MKPLDTFLASSEDWNQSNQWIKFRWGQVYCRNCPRRYVDGVRVRSFDIANIDIPEENRGKGNFTRFLTAVESRWDGTIYLENVIEPRLVKALIARGYQSIQYPAGRNPEHPVSLYKVNTVPAKKTPATAE